MPYLDHYIGDWTAEEARHLLKRTTFGPSPTMVEYARVLGLEDTVEMLFEALPLPNPPVRVQEDDQFQDPEVAFGETWVNASPFPNVSEQDRNRTNRWRRVSLWSWTFLRLHEDEMNIREKMAMFWHNHFVVSESFSPHLEYPYYSLLRQYATGNFRELTKEITIDSGMLFYLSGADNHKNAPNDNYARELLELFTIGKGPQIGTGDYTNYTEEDILAISKVLTGWQVQWEDGDSPLSPIFNPYRHTNGPKTLSHRFNQAVIEEAGENEFRNMIDVIFQQEECSRFIMRKLYRWFVNDTITADIEENIIEPLALILRENEYEISAPLKVLFQSDHFFQSIRCMIKSPIDLLLSASKGLGVQINDDLQSSYYMGLNFYRMAAEMEQALFNHPLVAGWKAYYQEPQYQKLWINNALLPTRQEYCSAIVEQFEFNLQGDQVSLLDQIPFLEIIGNITDAEDPNILIQELAKMMFNYPLIDSQITSLKEFLIPGLPDFEWTDEYNLYLSNPNNEQTRDAVTMRLRSLFSVMVRMSEFQIM